MEKKIINRTIMVLLSFAKNVFPMSTDSLPDINKMLLRDNFISLLTREFEKDIADQSPLVLNLSMRALSTNEDTFLKEKFFLDRFRQCVKMTLVSKCMYTAYSVLIIQKYASDFLVRAYITREIAPISTDLLKNPYFNYAKINTDIIDNIWQLSEKKDDLSRAQVQRMLYALFQTYGGTWDQSEDWWIKYKLAVNRSIQYRILDVMVQAKLPLSKSNLSEVLQHAMKSFEPKYFSTFLDKNSAALVYVNKDNQQKNCKKILLDPNFKDNIGPMLEQLPDDQKFYFIEMENKIH